MDSNHRLLRFSLLIRCSLLLAACTTSLLGLWAPNSLSVAITTESAAENVVQVAMLMLTAVGLLDVFINDVLPARYHMRWSKRRRHLGFAALGGLYLIKAFGGAGTAVQGGWVIVLYYLGLGMLCAWYTFAAALRPSHAL